MDLTDSDQRSRRLLVAILCAAAFATSADEPSLWLAQSRGVTQVDIEDGSALLELAIQTGAQAVASDTVRGTVWTLSQQSLIAHDRNGALLFHVEVSGPSGEPAFLSVDSDSGTVWLALHSQISAFSAGGERLFHRRLPKPVSAATFDPARNQFWYAFDNIVEVIDAGGILVSSQLVDGVKAIAALAFDVVGDYSWIVADETLRRVPWENIGSELVASDRLYRDAFLLASDGHGGVWVADSRWLRRVAETGTIIHEQRPFQGDSPEQIRALAANSHEGSIWVASTRAIAHIEADGTLRTNAIPDPGDGKTRNIAGLALEGGIVGPRIQFTSPTGGALLNDARPVFHLAYSGTDLDLSSIAISEDDSLLAITCSALLASAECTPALALAEGAHALAATIATTTGQVASPAILRFTVDTVSPSVTLVSPQQGFLTNDPSLIISGTLSEPASVVVNGEAATVGGLQFERGPVTLTEGVNTFNIVAMDSAGNSYTLILSGFLDTTPPAAPIVPAIQVTSSSGQVFVAGSAGSIESGALVTVTNLTTGVTMTVTANADGSFSAVLAGGPGDQLQIWATDAAGNQGGSTTFTVPEDGGGNGGYEEHRFSGPIDVLAISPADGTAVEGNYVLVTVDVDAPPNTGVLINEKPGVPLLHSSGLRYHAWLPVESGANAIAVTVRGQDGRTIEDVLEITSIEPSPYLITAHPSVGSKPLTVGFDVADELGLGIWDMEVDFTTDGVVDLITEGTDPIVHTYTGIGLHHAEFWVFDDSGVGHQQVVPIVVMDPAVLDNSIQAVWGAMNDALVAGEIEAALLYLSPGAKARYRLVFEALEDRLPDIVASYSPLRQSYVASGYAEYGINRMVDGVNRLYLVSFVRNEFGQWMIDSM